MEEIELTEDLSPKGHTRQTYHRLLTNLGFTPDKGGMRTHFGRGVAVEVSDTLFGSKVRGFRL